MEEKLIWFLAGYGASTICWLCLGAVLRRISRILADRRRARGKIRYLTPRLVLENRTRDDRMSALDEEFWSVKP